MWLWASRQVRKKRMSPITWFKRAWSVPERSIPGSSCHLKIKGKRGTRKRELYSTTSSRCSAVIVWEVHITVKGSSLHAEPESQHHPGWDGRHGNKWTPPEHEVLNAYRSLRSAALGLTIESRCKKRKFWVCCVHNRWSPTGPQVTWKHALLFGCFSYTGDVTQKLQRRWLLNIVTDIRAQWSN